MHIGGEFMKTTIDRWEREYRIKQDLDDEKSVQEEDRFKDYYGWLCDKELCVESGV